ncbi:thioesterase superfamily protein [Cavenderia fasciculata]|uniref:Thioesterase superfamily protein n=1 Tax=Cavenderia fasciculata TaxID=261658 RepID=F4PLA4_CACFS|nr:thioesterase superfamily protein [Cavenderia fasciculata]EGG23326.1 thioesterase superfamily protein [Cavenderia fasciculata]|eukprot:XP_004361177.1 thioesterase superfamily protein [Cavenderia fasciculata]
MPSMEANIILQNDGDMERYESSLVKFMESMESNVCYERTICDQLSLETIDFKKNQLTYVMVVPKEFCNLLNTLHGGIIASLCDVVSSNAVVLFTNDTKQSFSIDLSINYATAAPLGQPITIVSNVYKIGKKLVFTETTISNTSGVCIAKGTHNKYIR